MTSNQFLFICTFYLSKALKPEDEKEFLFADGQGSAVQMSGL